MDNTYNNDIAKNETWKEYNNIANWENQNWQEVFSNLLYFIILSNHGVNKFAVILKAVCVKNPIEDLDWFIGKVNI